MSTESLRPGMRFGAYEVVGVLGSGAFGVVYEAQRHPLRKRVALKVLHAGMVGIPEATARFLREAETAVQLHHPHIVEVHDLGYCEGVPFIAMELLRGETLKDRIEREGRLSVETALDLMLPVLSAVAAMHAGGFVHRDLKPANVFITQGPHGDHPKLLDFGIVKVQRDHSALTRTASVLGTPSFMAPEQVREARDVDERADVWSLGVMLYYCATGVVPFAGESMFETFDQVMHGPIVPPSKRVGAIPVGFDAVIGRAMKREVPARTPTVRELGRALLPFASPTAQAVWGREFLRNISGSPSLRRSDVTAEPAPTMVESAAKAPRRSRRLALVLGAVAALLVAAMGTLMWREEQPAPTPPTRSTGPGRVTPLVVPGATRAAPSARVLSNDAAPRPPEPARQRAVRERRAPAGRRQEPGSVIGNY